MTTLQLSLADILKERHPHGFHAPADIDISTFLEFADDDWTHELDIESLLAEQRLIGIVWNIQLVLAERPDLTDEQAWQVLQDCQPSFTEVTEPMRDTIRQMAERLFPQPRGKAALRVLLDRIAQKIDRLPNDEPTDPAGFRSVTELLNVIATNLKGN